MRLALVAAGVLAGCSSDLPASSHIDKLRVLAVRAEPPEVAPGQTTTLDALVVEPIVSQVNDLGPPKGALSYYWLACSIPPGAAEELPCGFDLIGGTDGGAPPTPPSCTDAPNADLCLLGSGPSVTLTPAASRIGADGTGQMLITMAVTDLGGGALLDCYNAVAMNGGMPVTADQSTSTADHCVLAVKRLAITDPARRQTALGAPPLPPNKNPTLTNFFYVDGAGMNVPLLGAGSGFTIAPDGFSARLTLAATRAADAAELEPQLGASGEPNVSGGAIVTQVEALSLSWFVTGGSIEGGRSVFVPPNCLTQVDCPNAMPISEAVTKWNPPTHAQLSQTSTANDPRVNFWAVIRDDRGGVGWAAGTATPWP
jgi:hypothetical protein